MNPLSKKTITVKDIDSIMRFNCWGTTAYVVGNLPHLKWFSQTEMEKWLHKKGQRYPEITNSMNEIINTYIKVLNTEIKTSFRRPLP